MLTPLFKNRKHAGELLAQKVFSLRNENLRILALPRGGVPVAAALAKKLHASLDIFIVRKLGLPSQPELAIGALAEDGTLWWNEALLARVSCSNKERKKIQAQEEERILRYKKLYRENRSLASVKNCTVLLVDDGLATGATALVGALALKRLGAEKVVVVAPVASSSAAERLRKEKIDTFSLLETEDFFGVGFWYQDFSQVEDAEVRRHLQEVA